MKVYTVTRTGFMVTAEWLKEQERAGLSDHQIHEMLGYSGSLSNGLSNIRQKLDCWRDDKIQQTYSDQILPAISLKNGTIITHSEIQEMETAMMSEQEIADKIGISRVALHNLRRRAGWVKRQYRSDKGEVKVSEDEKREKMRNYMQKYRKEKPEKFAYKMAADAGKVGYAHRQLAEQLLNRPLTENEIIHHIDGKKDNNDPGNLIVAPKNLHRLFDSIPVENQIMFAREHPHCFYLEDYRP